MSQVQCVTAGVWYCPASNEDFSGPTPQFMNIYTVVGDFVYAKQRYLVFAEFPRHNGRGGRDGWLEDYFRQIEPLPPEEIKIEERVS